MALDNTKIKSKITLDAVLVLNKLGENNQVLIRWIPADSGYVGNEKKNTIAKKEPITLTFGSPSHIMKKMRPCSSCRFPWDVAIRERTKHNMD